MLNFGNARAVMHVRVADSSSRNPNQNIGWTDLGTWNFNILQRLSNLSEPYCSHYKNSSHVTLAMNPRLESICGAGEGQTLIVYLIRRAMLEWDQHVWHAGPAGDMRPTQSLQAKWSRRQAAPDCVPKPHTIVTQSSGRARMLTRSRSRVL